MAVSMVEGSAATSGHFSPSAIAGATYQSQRIVGSQRIVESQGGDGTAASGTASTVALALTQGLSVTDVMTVLATVGGGVAASQTPIGKVQFSYTLNGGRTQALGALVTLDPSGAAVLRLDQGLPSVGPGPYSFVIKAAYTPTPLSQFTAGVSAPLLVGSQGSNPPPCTSSCPDPRTMVVTVPAGSLVISIPYATTHQLELGSRTVNANDTEESASAPFGTVAPAGTDPAVPTTNRVTITDTRIGNLGWTASAQTTGLYAPTGSTTPTTGDNLSFTGVTPEYLEGNGLQAGSVGTDDITALGTTAKSFAHKDEGQGPGTVDIYGTLGLTATSTHAGANAATVTFTIA
jgi:hypothetical protein